uniref:LLGL domain-containing protein n=1 Tax=Macrostomum lignano TaxID=282301 RepID=A0A1I8HZZ0_9PLAT
MAKLIGTFRDLPHKLHLSSGGQAKASDKQLKQFKEFFDLGELCKIGFPDNATTIAHDPQLNLLAIGTKTGEILIYGAPGHEFSACHKDACEIKQLLFLPEEGRLVSLTSDNRLHKWELNENTSGSHSNWRLEHAADLLAGPADGADGQTATTMGLIGGDRLCLGYASGSVRLVEVKDWKFAESATSGEAIDKGLTEEARSQLHGWGSVVSIEASPTTGKQIAIGFSSGTVAVLNSSDCSLHSVAPGAAELRCLSWQTDASAIYTGHSDGSYAVWRADEPAEASRLLKTADNPQTVYGPFPCLPVTHLVHRTAKLGSITVLAGGMAKNTHADRHTVTLLREQEHVCLDLCSPVVDLALLCSPGDGNTGQAGYDEPHTLLVLCESQLVALDLYGAQWPEFRLPYLSAVSATGAPITAARIYGAETAGTEQIRAALLAAASNSSSSGYSTRAWPINGGKTLVRPAAEESEKPPATEPAAANQEATTSAGGDSEAKQAIWDLLVTGHGDGSVAFWQIGQTGSGTSAALLYTLNTADVFSDAPAAEAAEPTDVGGFPPFRAVGQRWRRSEMVDDRFAVTVIDLASDCLLVGGAAGQATLWRLAAAGAAAAPVEVDVRTVNADIVSPGKDSPYAWEGQAPLRVREEPWQPPAGRLFEPASIISAFPPDRICSLTLDVGRGLAAVGTGFGLALIDTGANRCLTTHCTLAVASQTGAAAAPPATPAKGSGSAAAAPSHSSAGSSITKSLRQSFRRLKKLRGGKRQEYTVTTEEAAEAAAAAGPSTSAETQPEAASEEPAAGTPAEKKKEKKEKEKKEKEKKDKKDKKEKKEEKAEEKKEEKPEEKKEEKAEEAKTESKTAEAEPTESATPAAESAPEAAAAVPEKPKQQPLTTELASESPGRIRCLLIADAHLVAAGVSTPALFAGDRSGRVYAFQVSVTDTAAATGEAAAAAPSKQANLVKELHLRHGAPVVAMHVTGEQQQLLVTSEQQVKLFSLPSLRPRCKARILPAEAPAKLRACGLAQFRPAPGSSQQPLTGLAVEDSLGRLMVLGLPQLKILAQLDRNDAAFGSLAYQPAGAVNPLAVAVAGRSASVWSTCPRPLTVATWLRPAWTCPIGPARPAAAAVAASASPAESAEADTPAAVGAEQQQEPEAEAADRSHHQVAADITMDDIKEYAAAAPLPPTETIPETTDEKSEPAAVTVEAAAEEAQQEQEEKPAPAAVEVVVEPAAKEDAKIEEAPAVSPAEIKAAIVNDGQEAPDASAAAGDTVAAEQ